MARKILLADDSVTAQNMGRKILADAGYEVIAVNNGSAALKKIAELKPELVILDVYMPGYSGLEVCQRLKESQETARIPVLLTVGKLEPFKPEEAQRVRAEGYIVKPFEASELLSALAKLEDKIVPRPEPSKPGRFARAMAAAEDGGRGSRSENTSNENGWKSRIGFPHPRTESVEGEKVADEASTYNPMNRDLRTVVETTEEKAGAKKKGGEEQPEAQTIVDVGGLAPAGLPRDVTPEELAAITAAAAQIQMAGAINAERQSPENRFSTSEKASPETPEPVAEHFADNCPPPEAPVASDEASQTNSVAGEPAAKVKHRRRKGDKRLEEEQDEPVTMAAAAESPAASAGAGRWKAVSVALEGDEAAISLDHEMQKAYAAFAAADSDVAASLPSVAAAPENSSAPAKVTVEEPVAEISSPEPEPASQPEPAVSMQTPEAEQVPVAQPEPLVEAPSFVAAEPVNSYQSTNANQQTEAAPVTADVEPVEEQAATSATVESTASTQEPAPHVIEDNVAAPDAPVPASWELPEAEVAAVEAATASSAGFAPIIQEPESKPDSEVVKSTAAAWASWRQIRETSKDSEVAPAASREFEASESAPVETNAKAMAVAASAEQILQAAVAAEPSRNPEDVASIVDSVLAGLRPKLMEEISRKMAEKK